MAVQIVSGISSVQAIAAYGGTQSDVSSLEKQRNRLMQELDKVNAAQGSEMQTPYRREQLQRQIRLLEAQLVQRSGSTTPAGFVPVPPLQDHPPLWRTEGKGGFKGIGLTDPRTATVDSEGHFNAWI
ncbi:FlxA-like family protein [Paenibacillus tengchongensis]|uniref:FlxA-like family protein n=1 Tax=Paenibacillus tengchongensis TaxID=2608684 RepID=UPI0016528DE5|nr:FlxA-like family protein [Paenibacillus tengchongensis]